MLKVNSSLFLNAVKDLKLKTNANITLVTNGDNLYLVNRDENTIIIKNIPSYSSCDCNFALLDSTIKLLSKIKCDDLFFDGSNIIAGKNKIKFTEGKRINIDSLKDINVVSYCEIPLEDLLNLCKVNYAAASDDTRPILKGVHFNNMNNDFLQVVSLDGYRLFLRSNREISFSNKCEFTVNNDSIVKLQKVAKKYDKNTIVKLELMKDYYLKISFEDITIYCKLIQGRFIKYESLLVDYCNKFNLLQIEDTKNTLRELELIKSVDQLVKLYNTDGVITLEVNDSENSLSIETSIKAINWNVEFIAFNVNYLIDTFKNSGYKNMYFASATSPAVLTNDLSSNDNLDLVLPIRRIRNN